jgi:hypothetical protein
VWGICEIPDIKHLDLRRPMVQKIPKRQKFFSCSSKGLCPHLHSLFLMMGSSKLKALLVLFLRKSTMDALAPHVVAAFDCKPMQESLLEVNRFPYPVTQSQYYCLYKGQ